MRVVSSFEAKLLQILYAILRPGPIEPILPLLRAQTPRPACLRREAVELVEKALAKGCIRRLAAQGGWRRERYLRGERVAAGRLWERTPPAELALVFSPRALEFLIVLTADWPEDWARRLPSHDLTVGDQLLAYLAFEALAATNLVSRLRACTVFDRSALYWLSYPGDVAHWKGAALDWSHWIMGVGSCVLEAWQGRFVQQWLQFESAKRGVTDVSALLKLAGAQAGVLDSFLEAIDRVGRRDLAGFILQVAAELLAKRTTVSDWAAGLVTEHLRLAERLEAQRASVYILRVLSQLHEWEQQARSIGYFDEGYAAAQLWKSVWERHAGDTLWQRAERLLQALPGNTIHHAR